jgi:hypothetical protein
VTDASLRLPRYARYAVGLRRIDESEPDSPPPLGAGTIEIAESTERDVARPPLYRF